MKTGITAACMGILLTTPTSPVFAQRESAAHLAARVALLNAEDGRDTGVALEPLTRALNGADAELRALAVRGLGRFEQLRFVPRLVPMLADSAWSVRAEAANALGMMAQRIRPGSDAIATLRTISDPLFMAAEREPDSRAANVFAIVVGRLPYRVAEDVGRAEELLVHAMERQSSAGRSGRMLAAARGLEQLIRRRGRFHPPAIHTLDVLRRASLMEQSVAVDGEWAMPYALPTDTVVDMVLVRRAAAEALVASGSVDSTLVEAWLRDEPEMRRQAVRAAAADSSHVRFAIGRTLSDGVFEVRFEALRAYGKQMRQSGCAPLLRALSDSNVHVALLAVDLIGDGCPADPAVAMLASIAKRIALITADDVTATASWHQGAHALVSLARLDPARARPILARFATHPVWQVRMYAARAAGAANDPETLRRFARDRNPNVRTAAIEGLGRSAAHAADDILLEALSDHDYQLVLTAARQLAGTPRRAEAATALLNALSRLTGERRETSRDARVALMTRLGAVGDSTVVNGVRPYLTDFDPVVADSASAVLVRWTGRAEHADPRPLPRRPMTAAELIALRGVRLRVSMARGGDFDVALFPDQAPFTARRIVELARAHFYDGIAFHRVEPNFVIEGPSPGDNEYAGDGPFMRDEIWLRSHGRGTVGISSRGRDTGDAQWFINLVDNPLLDFEFTVAGGVVRHMPVVSGILEGDMVRRVEVIAP